MNNNDIYRIAVVANNVFERAKGQNVTDISVMTKLITDEVKRNLQILEVIGVQQVNISFSHKPLRVSTLYHYARADFGDGILLITILVPAGFTVGEPVEVNTFNATTGEKSSSEVDKSQLTEGERQLMDQATEGNTTLEELANAPTASWEEIAEQVARHSTSPMAEKFNSLTSSIGSDQKYAWAGDVYDYLDMYKTDIETVLGVDDIRLYKDGIRMAVGLLFDAADKYEDKERKKSFKAYIVHKMLSHIDDLTRRVAKADEMFTGVNQGLQMLSQAAKGYRDPIPPHGFTGQTLPEIKQPDAYERALQKQRENTLVGTILGNTKDTPYMG